MIYSLLSWMIFVYDYHRNCFTTLKKWKKVRAWQFASCHNSRGRSSQITSVKNRGPVTSLRFLWLTSVVIIKRYSFHLCLDAATDKIFLGLSLKSKFGSSSDLNTKSDYQNLAQAKFKYLSSEKEVECLNSFSKAVSRATSFSLWIL